MFGIYCCRCVDPVSYIILHSTVYNDGGDVGGIARYSSEWYRTLSLEWYRRWSCGWYRTLSLEFYT